PMKMQLGFEQKRIGRCPGGFNLGRDIVGAGARCDQHHRGLFRRPGLHPGLVGPFEHAHDDHPQDDEEDQEAEHHTLDRMSAALVPPKPKLLDMATSTLWSRATLGTRSIAVVTSGLSRLMVGGTLPSRIASRQKIASTAPAAPRRWP